jgi:DNA-binding transcriptional regulator YiaG
MKPKKPTEVERLRAYKERAGLSYDNLGHALGVHSQTVYHWITGKHKPSQMARRLIRNYLNRADFD